MYFKSVPWQPLVFVRTPAGPPRAIPFHQIQSIGRNYVGSVPCGPVRCPAGMKCCNPSCGICTMPGGACVMLDCGGRPWLSGLGATELGEAVAVGSNDLLRTDGTLYTFRTGATMPLDPNAQSSICYSTWDCIWVSRETAWQRARSLNYPISPPASVSDFWQSQTSETGPDGRRSWRTSLTFIVNRSGQTAEQIASYAIRVLNAMRPIEGEPQPPMVIYTGQVYERRGSRDAAATPPTIIDRITEAVTGQSPAAAARERARTEARRDKELLIGKIAAGAAFLLAALVASRPGARKLETRYAAAREQKSERRARTVGAASGGFARGLASLGRKGNPRRRRRRRRR